MSSSRRATPTPKNQSVSNPTAFRKARRSPVLAILFLLILSILTVTANAQTGQGSITGKVTDGTGDLVPHANVAITNHETGVTLRTKTNDAGFYTLGSLNPAVYSVGITAKGFQTQVVEDITLEAASVVQIDIKLKVGSEDTSVTVTAQDSLLSKDSSDVITTVDHSLVESLPYPERSSLEAALLVPGVLGDPTAPGGIQPENPGATGASITPGANIGIGGAPPGTASILVDGSDVTQASYPRAGVNLSGQIVQETTVITGGLSAKYGRTSGGTIVQTSRAGTNQYHGRITWRHTDPAFEATPLGSTPTPPDLHENYYGFYIGGPVLIPKVYGRRHNTFFFVGVEPARLRNSGGARGTFLTPDDLAGHLNNTLPLLNQSTLKSSGYAAALAAPRTGGIYFQAPVNAQQFPSGPMYSTSGGYMQVPGNDVSGQLAQNPFAKFVMSQMPTPTNPGPYVVFDNPGGTYDNAGQNGVFIRGVKNQDNRYSGRIDTQFGNRDQLFVRYTVIPVSAVRFDAVAETNPIDQQPTDAARTHDVAIGETHVFSNAIVNNFHYSWLRVNQVRGLPPGATTEDFAAKYGLTPATVGYGFPSLGSLSVSGVGYTISPGVAPGGTGPGQQIDQNFILGDDVSWQHRQHLFQFGADLRWIQSNQYGNSYLTGGAYSFSQGFTNNGSSGGVPLATFDLGLISSYTGAPVRVPGYYRWRYDAAYFQDDWRVTPTITLNLGVRYNVETPRMEKFNNQPIFAVNQAGTLNGLATSSAICFPNACPGIGKTLWPINWKGVEPRMGISIATTRKTTVRAAYGITRLPLTGYYNLPLPDISVTPAIGGNTGGAIANQVVDYITNPVGSATSAYQTLNPMRGAPILATRALAQPIYVPQTSSVPYTQTWNLTIQYQPAASTLVQITYQGLKGTHLLAPFNGGQFGDINQPSIGTVTSAVQNHSNLSRVLTNCSAMGTTSGCGNPYQLTQNGSVLVETKLQALQAYQNYYLASIPDDFERHGTSQYDGFLASVTHREGRNLSLLANYTWTKSIDNVANTTLANNAPSGSSPPPQDPFDLRAERSLSIFDQPSRFKVGYNYQLPFGKGQHFHTHHGWVDNLIGNIGTSGIYTVQSGFPNFVTLGSTGYFTSITPNGTDGCTATYCTATALPTGYTLRPDRVPGVPIINKNWKHGGGGNFSSSFVSYINPAAFTTPGSLNNPKLGNAPRTLGDARSPRETFFDARVVKGFALRSKYHLNLTATFNNAFNHPVYFGIDQSSKNLYTTASVSTSAGTITQNPASTTFGKVTNSSSNFSRVIRVGAEFTF
jgi:hypothetical protein